MSEGKERSSSRGGRPRSFDREAAVVTAMDLFWRYGYEGVSISDLTAAIGIAPPSLYAAFGSKAELFKEAVVQYEAGPGSLDLAVLERAASLADGVKCLLSAAIASVSGSGRACMVSGGMLACHRDHNQLARHLSDRRRAFEAALEERLALWVEPSEATSLARYLVAVMQGISIHALDGTTASELEDLASYASAALTRSGM